MAHRYRNLPVAALKALHARERRALEVLLQCRGNRVRLLGRQKPELELLLVVNEVARLHLRALANYDLFHDAIHYTKTHRII